MTTLFISEFQYPNDGTIGTPNAAGWITDQKIAVAASSTPSTAFNSLTRFVLLLADVTCSISWTLPGATVNAATVNNFLLPANVRVRFAVLPGMIVSNIANS